MLSVNVHSVMPGAWLISGNRQMTEEEQNQGFDEMIAILKKKQMEWGQDDETWEKANTCSEGHHQNEWSKSKQLAGC